MKFSIIVLFTLLTSIFFAHGQVKSGIFPPEKFYVLEAKLPNGKPIVGSVNKAYKIFRNKQSYPWCLKINIALDLKGCKDNGLPLKPESDIANKFEDELLKEIQKLAIAHYVGHMYNDTFLDVYIPG